ncbi:MAG: type II toxin-antitoxin system PemK/MazF family toxin [Saprospiraceae bacterium]|nr:type II toxin-antitoxin system PemK/MazF family toxin [Lewinella sp.]
MKKRLTQYQVVIVNLDPTIGNEIKKTRPCVIISPNEMNRPLRTVVIAPITSKTKQYPTRIKIDFQGNENWVVVDQIRTIDKRRITKSLEKLSKEEIKKIKEVIRETFVD